jgi:hypothetical protein
LANWTTEQTDRHISPMVAMSCLVSIRKDLQAMQASPPMASR